MSFENEIPQEILDDPQRYLKHLDNQESLYKNELEVVKAINLLGNDSNFKMLLKDLDNQSMTEQKNLCNPAMRDNSNNFLMGISYFKQHLSSCSARQQFAENALESIKISRDEVNQVLNSQEVV